MIVTPDTHRLDVESDIRPPLAHAVTIPLSIDLRHPMFDGYVLYVARSAFMDPSPDADRVVKAIATAIGEHLKTLPPVDVP